MSTLFPRNTIDYLIVTSTLIRSTGKYRERRTASTFIGSVQPVTGKDIETVETGKEDRGLIKAYSDTKLNVSISGTNKPGDIILWEGKEWECIKEEAFQNLIKHYKYTAQFLRETS